MKPLKIGVSYLLFMSLVAPFAVRKISDCLELKRVTRVVSGANRADPVPPNGYYLIGDCTALFECPRFASTRVKIKDIISRVKKLPSSDTTAQVIVMCGRNDISRSKGELFADSPETVRANLQNLSQVLHDRFPNATITIVDPYDIAKAADKDEWHLSDNRYKTLFSKYPVLSDLASAL